MLLNVELKALIEVAVGLEAWKKDGDVALGWLDFFSVQFMVVLNPLLGSMVLWGFNSFSICKISRSTGFKNFKGLSRPSCRVLAVLLCFVFIGDLEMLFGKKREEST